MPEHSKRNITPEKATKKQFAESLHMAHIDLFRWEFTCKTEAPYPLNYLPFSDDPQDRVLGIMIGMLIEKGYA